MSTQAFQTEGDAAKHNRAIAQPKSCFFFHRIFQHPTIPLVRAHGFLQVPDDAVQLLNLSPPRRVLGEIRIFRASKMPLVYAITLVSENTLVTCIILKHRDVLSHFTCQASKTLGDDPTSYINRTADSNNILRSQSYFQTLQVSLVLCGADGFWLSYIQVCSDANKSKVPGDTFGFP
jgi:hypothetical protein